VTVWDVAGGAKALELRGHGSYVFALAYGPDGARLATASADRTVKVWDGATGRELLALTGHLDRVNDVAFGGPRLASASRDGTVCVWDAQTGRKLFTLPGRSPTADGLTVGPGPWAVLSPRLFWGSASVTGVAFSPDGRLLAAASSPMVRSLAGEVRLWEADTGRAVRAFPAHTGAIASVAFSPCGRLLVTAGIEDRTVRVWDVSTGRRTAVFRGHFGPVQRAAFSRPDGRFVYSAGSDHTVRAWEHSPEKGRASSLVQEGRARRPSRAAEQ
jgi:WD40 repeat protein